MATFLELVQDVARESGTVGSHALLRDVAVPGDSRQEKLVHWVRDAWLRIQRSRDDWRFLIRETTFVLEPDRAVYPLSLTVPAGGFGRWKPDTVLDRAAMISDPANPSRGTNPLYRIGWPEGRHRLLMPRQVRGMPVEYAIAPDDSFIVPEAPDAPYLVVAQYVAAPQRLVDNGDTPRMPAQWHDVIVSRALMLLAGHDEANIAFADAKARFDADYRLLVNAQTPNATIG